MLNGLVRLKKNVVCVNDSDVTFLPSLGSGGIHEVAFVRKCDRWRSDVAQNVEAAIRRT